MALIQECDGFQSPPSTSCSAHVRVHPLSTLWLQLSLGPKGLGWHCIIDLPRAREAIPQPSRLTEVVSRDTGNSLTRLRGASVVNLLLFTFFAPHIFIFLEISCYGLTVPLLSFYNRLMGEPFKWFEHLRDHAADRALVDSIESSLIPT